MNELEKEQDRQYNLLNTLSKNEAFITWRDLVAKPIIDQIESQLLQPQELDEIKLKSLLMYRNLVKSLFYTIFEQIKLEKQLEEQQKEITNDRPR